MHFRARTALLAFLEKQKISTQAGYGAIYGPHHLPGFFSGLFSGGVMLSVAL